MKHVMLDLETFGVKPGVIIRSIGAVEFELDGRIGKSIYANVDRKSCEAIGLVSDPRTEQWWREQSKAAQEALLVDPKPLKDVVDGFYKWFLNCGADFVWSHGAAFDPVIFEAAAHAAKGQVPWKFYNVRDTRTTYDLFGFDIRDVWRDGTYHNALDDAKYQVKCVALAVAKGRKPGTVYESGAFE
jgi:hypothetical protein